MLPHPLPPLTRLPRLPRACSSDDEGGALPNGRRSGFRIQLSFFGMLFTHLEAWVTAESGAQRGEACREEREQACNQVHGCSEGCEGVAQRGAHGGERGGCGIAARQVRGDVGLVGAQICALKQGARAQQEYA